MASRPSSRPGGGRRLLIAALIVTILVVLFDASLKSRSPGPARTLGGQAWIDRVLPVIASSSTEGKVITQVRTAGLGMPAASISAQLQQAAQQAQANYQTVVSLGSPSGAGGAPGLLQACLAVRAEAAHAAAGAVAAVLAGSAPAAPGGQSDPNVQALATAGRDFSISDRAYQLFASTIPNALGVTMPSSTWTPDPTIWDAGGIQVFLVALRNGTSLSPVHQVAIEAISTNPPPVGLSGAVQDIAPTPSIAVTIVVADTGNQPERNLTISAVVAPAVPGRGGAVRDFTSLSPGGSYATTIGPLVPVSGTAGTLTVTVTAPPGSATPTATRTLPIEVAAPPPPTTTTSTTSGPAVPGAASTTTSTTAAAGGAG